MLYYKNNEWNISNEKIKYIQNKIELENYVGQEGKHWWLDLQKLHQDIKIIEFIDIEVTDEQVARLEEINKLNIDDGYSSILSDYVIRNKFPDETNHILKDLENKKTNEDLRMEQTVSNMELGGAMQMLNMQNEVSQAEMLMEIGNLLEQLQGGK